MKDVALFAPMGPSIVAGSHLLIRAATQGGDIRHNLPMSPAMFSRCSILPLSIVLLTMLFRSLRAVSSAAGASP